MTVSPFICLKCIKYEFVFLQSMFENTDKIKITKTTCRNYQNNQGVYYTFIVELAHTRRGVSACTDALLCRGLIAQNTYKMDSSIQR